MDRLDDVQIDLDPTEAERKKELRRRRLNVVEYPLARLVGNGLLVLMVFLHNVFVLGALSARAFTTFAMSMVLYSVVSWVVLAQFHTKVRRFDLGTFFMTLDIATWIYAIYVSGGERSWLFFLMIMRAADQRLAGVRRVLGYTIVSAASYALLMLYLGFVEQRELNGMAELGKLLILVSV